MMHIFIFSGKGVVFLRRSNDADSVRGWDKAQSISKHILHGREPLNAIHIRENIIMKHTPTEGEIV